MSKPTLVQARNAAEEARLKAKVARAAEEWSAARKDLVAAQDRVNRAEHVFDAAQRKLIKFHQPDLFEGKEIPL